MKKIAALILALLMLVSLSACGGATQPVGATIVVTGADGESILNAEYEVGTIKNAGDFTTSVFDAEKISYEAGDGMLTSINALAGTDSDGWLMYYNGKLGEVGAWDQEIKNGDAIEWKYENYSAAFGF